MQRKHYEPEHEAFAESFRAFPDKEIVPHYLEWERAGITPRELFPAAGRSGFLGMAVPEQYGGGGVEDFRFNQALDEQIALAGITGAGLGISLHNDTCLPYFLTYANDEQKQRWLPGIVSRRADHRGRDDRTRRRLRPVRHPHIGRARRRRLHRQRGQDVHHQRHQRRPRDHRSPDGRGPARAACRC